MYSTWHVIKELSKSGCVTYLLKEAYISHPTTIITITTTEGDLPHELIWRTLVWGHIYCGTGSQSDTDRVPEVTLPPVDHLQSLTPYTYLSSLPSSHQQLRSLGWSTQPKEWQRAIENQIYRNKLMKPIFRTDFDNRKAYDGPPRLLDYYSFLLTNHCRVLWLAQISWLWWELMARLRMQSTRRHTILNQGAPARRPNLEWQC